VIRAGALSAALLVLSVTPALTGCGGDLGEVGWLAGTPRRYAGQGTLRLLWTQRITPEYEGEFLPVERALAALDPRHDRIFVGSTAGKLYAMRADGGRLWSYDAGGPIESRPAVDARRGEVFVGTEQGVLHKLNAETGELAWRERTGGPIRQAPLLTDDAVYLVSDTDVVTAHSRADGEKLWTYHRDAPETYSIAGHAGLARAGRYLVTGFTDGVVVALDPADGRVAWEQDTSLEVEGPEGGRPQFVDIDTTPVLAGETLYVASFAGGVYGLDAESGTVLWHEPRWTGVVGIAHTTDVLVLSSADEGVVCLRNDDARTLLWKHAFERGAPSGPVVAADTVFVGLSQGAFVALSLGTGEETSRFEAGHGFSTPPSLHRGVGFVLANGGSLFAFSY
jgi:outer membrane protein assembly factor BamB